MVSDEKKKEIQQALFEVEKKHGVEVLYAIESGSRAWGFHSKDSDYDVRFIYKRPEDWYLSVFDGRDVIEEKITDDLDISGWDIRKTLQLATKTNPSLYEWMHSDIYYLYSPYFWGQMMTIMTHYYNHIHLVYHYRSMMKHNYREHLRNREQVKLKKYLYVMRACLAAKAVEQAGNNMVNVMNTEGMVRALVEDEEVRDQMHSLILRKRRADKELALGPVIPCINAYFDKALEHYESIMENPHKKIAPDQDMINQFFRTIIRHKDYDTRR